MTNKQNSIFDKFTNKYELSKTLRFELEPVPETKELLKENKVFEKDQTIDDSYNQAKFYFDTLHQKFINQALASENVKDLPFADFVNVLDKENKVISEKKKELNELRKNKSSSSDVDKVQKKINEAEDKIDKQRQILYKKVREQFDITAENWKASYQNVTLESREKIKLSEADKKQKGVDFLTSAGILQILKHEFPESKEKEYQANKWSSLYVEEKENPGKMRYIFDSFDGFSGYLSKFQQTRENLYVDTGKATAVATRIVDNLVIFLQNKKVYDDKYRGKEEIKFKNTDIFDIGKYSNYLLQRGIEAVEGETGSEHSYNKIIGTINKAIKEFRDGKESEAKKLKTSFKKNDYPLFKTLEKQILGKVEKQRELIEKTETESIEDVFVKRFREFIDNNEERFSKAKELISNLCAGEYEPEYEQVYLKNTAINTISRRWFSNSRDFELKLPQRGKQKGKGQESDEPKVKKFVSLADVKNAIEQLEGDIFIHDFKDRQENKFAQFLTIWGIEFKALFEDKLIKDQSGKTLETIPGYNSSLEKAKGLKNFSPKRDKSEIAIVKNYADASLRIFQMLKYLELNDKDRSDTPGKLSTDFYAEFDEYTKGRSVSFNESNKDFDFIRYYNAFRNFITKKPFDDDKIKLNFENGALLTGWDQNKEYDYMGIIFQKGELYFLGLMHKKQRDLFKENSVFSASTGKYKKMLYKQIADASKDIPRLLLSSKKAVQTFMPSPEILKIKKSGTYKKLLGTSTKQNPNFSLTNLRILIDYYKKCISKYENWKYYDFSSLKETKSYLSIAEFTDDVQRCGYKVDFTYIQDRYLDQIVKEGKLYLFKIINKDIKNLKGGVKNIHSYYFEQLLSKNNLENPTLKLSGGAEIFFRKSSFDKKEHIYTKGKNFKLEKGEKAFKLNRYRNDKILLHMSIVLNPNKGKAVKFDREINEILADNKDINVVGIDRGEKHLLYYSVVNQKGEILEQGSLNKIKVGDREVDFHQKLVEREKERLLNRQSWEPVGRIKDLKKGYISHVIHLVTKLIIKHNAIVVLEDLNMRFKQIRGGIERSVYQQFEKALIDKLGYLVFKDRERGLREPGGVLNGYQLAAPFISFEKLGKQTGILFYTQADYTSVTDPITGFRKNLYISNSASQEKIKETIEKFDAIGWDDKEQSYFFDYNPVNFVEDKYKKDTLSKKWRVYAKALRIRREKVNGYWDYKSVDVNQKFLDLFQEWGFENQKAEDLKEEILRKREDEELTELKEFDGKRTDFWHSFIYLFNLVLQVRNSFSMQIKTKDGKIEEIKDGVDFIASPVWPFFATRAVNEKGEVLSELKFESFKNKFIGSKEGRSKFLETFNGDANGAYNITRKGIMILEKIKQNPEKPNLFISKYDWDDWVNENKMK